MENKNNTGITVLSVGDAHTQASRTTDRTLLKEIANQVAQQNEIRGDADEYHNLAVEYTREWDDYVSGYEIVKKGLSQYPANIDLLADAIYYGSSAGRYQECEKHVEAMSKLPFAMWNWRAFTFLIDYFLDQLDWIPWGEESEKTNHDVIQQQLEKALYFAKLEQKILFGSGEVERGYVAENKVRLMKEKVLRAEAALLELQDDADIGKAEQLRQEAEEEHKKAEDVLQIAIDDGHFAAYSCCLRLADILFERQEYERTIEVCESALKFVQSQPSANTAYFTYLIALSKDALIYRDGAYKDEERVLEVYQDYKCAFELNSSRGRQVYLRNIQDRLSILEAKTGFNAPVL